MEDKFLVEIHNLPGYPLHRWVVVRYDMPTQSLWFHCTTNDKEDACSRAKALVNGLVVEKQINW